MSRRLLEVAVRPVRLAFLLGTKPSNRLLNAVISVNSGLWGGIYNFICPSDGSALLDEYLQLLKCHTPDCILLCGRFIDKKNVIRQLQEHHIQPCFLYKAIALESIVRLGIGVEGIYDSRFLQSLRHGTLSYTGVVDPRLTPTNIFEKVMFGIPPPRLKKYIEDRVDIITLNRYKKELEREKSAFDELIGIIQITKENLESYRTVEGRRLVVPPYRFGRIYFVVGNENNLKDACYFWNLRAILGVDRVRWVALNDLDFLLRKREVAHAPMLTLTSAPRAYRDEIRNTLKEVRALKGRVLYSQAKGIFRLRANTVWQSEVRREHVATSNGEVVLPISRPSSFDLVYPKRYPRWVVDFRIVRDDVIGTEGFILPNRSYLFEMVTPGRSARLHPRIHGDILSIQVTSARTDEHIKLRIPTDWEIIRAIFAQSGYRICFSDQGNYMSRALSLFGGLDRLSSLLRDARATAILDGFMKHHRSGERTVEGSPYRRALTLEDMRKVVLNLTGPKSRKNKEKNIRFIDELLRELIGLDAIHSGYVLDCSKCKLEDWYPIDEVSEDFRCRRCLAKEIRPLSPAVSFRLNESFYQAYLHNFAVPTLVLDILQKFTNTSFAFAPQIKLNERDEHSPEIDVVALCDGNLIVGEAKSTDRIKKDQIHCLESTALAIKAQRIVLGTTNRDSCCDIDCTVCSKNSNYADNAFTHGTSQSPQFWGTKECIQDLRRRLSKDGIEVTSICAQDILLGTMQRNRPRRVFVPTKQPF